MNKTIKEYLAIIGITFLVGGIMHVARKLEKEIIIDELLKKGD